MSLAETPKSSNLISRVQNILLKPKTEWDVIDVEPHTVQGLFTGYACILAAIPVIAQIIGQLAFPSVCVLGVCVHINPMFVIIGAIVSYIVSLVGVYVIGLIIDALAPTFGGTPNQLQAMKVSVYSFTAAWLAGIFAIVPMLGILGILGLYSFYLLVLGLPKLMKSPADKALGYTAVSIILGIVVFIIAGAIGGLVTRMGTPAPTVSLGVNSPITGTVNLGGASVDLSKLQAAADAAKAAQANAASGKLVAVDPNTLKGLLPDTVAGAARTEVTAASGGAAGIGGSTAEATYQNGNARVTVTVVDLAAMGGMAAIAGAANIQSDQETATGYEKVSTQNGRMVTEKYDNTSKSGEYSVIVANRFTVSAEGSGVSIDDLKAAVAAVGPDRLEAMAHS